ncbi:hypothetical protein NFI96_027838, partial [Prochilodus magdalenae]
LLYISRLRPRTQRGRLRRGLRSSTSFFLDEEAARIAALRKEEEKKNSEPSPSTLQDPEKFSGTLIQVANHLSILKFTVWEKMKEIAEYSPVTLDPNTAHPLLILSDELTKVIGEKFPDFDSSESSHLASITGGLCSITPGCHVAPHVSIQPAAVQVSLPPSHG